VVLVCLGSLIAIGGLSWRPQPFQGHRQAVRHVRPTSLLRRVGARCDEEGRGKTKNPCSSRWQRNTCGGLQTDNAAAWNTHRGVPHGSHATPKFGATFFLRESLAVIQKTTRTSVRHGIRMEHHGAHSKRRIGHRNSPNKGCVVFVES
jgi:hypothetical protein